MITIVCTHCKHALHATGEVSEVNQLVGQQSDFWPDKYRCWECDRYMEGFLTPEVSSAVANELTIIEVTAQEAFAALNGLGLPQERVVDPDTVLELFETVGLKVKGKSYRGQHRYFIDEIVFPNGVKLHLGASPQGAAVYRIVKPHSYARTNDVG